MSLGTKSITDAYSAPQFPPPPLAPIRSRGRGRSSHEANPIPMPMIRAREGPLQSRHIAPVSRFSIDSDRSSSFSVDSGSFSQRGVVGLGLRPAPQRRVTTTFRTSMAPIPGSPTDETDNGDSLSPIMSGAPPPPKYPPKVVTPSSPRDDTIPNEHKRVPGLIPRSPLSPVAAGLASMARRAVRRPVPSPIVVQPLPKSKFFQKQDDSPDSATVVIGIETLPVPVTDEKPKSKRKTMWGFNVEGWWELGLLERMNTVRRKNTTKH